MVPGASVAVSDRGRVVAAVAGVSEVSSRRPVTARTPFRIASVTKMFFAALVLRLVDAGKLALDRPIHEYGVELPKSAEFAGVRTLRQLLSHTSGLAQTFTRDEDRHSRLTLSEELDRMPEPACAAGACFSYADANYVLVALVLEAATGRKVAELVQEQVADVAGLRDTRVVPAESGEPLPPQYALVHEGGEVAEPRRLFEQSLPRTETLITTASDLTAFAAALFGGKLLAPGTLALMLDTRTMKGLPCPVSCPFSYGLGVFHYRIRGRDLVGHDGSSGTIVVHDQARGMTIAILTNGGEQDVRRFLEAVLEAVDAD